MPLEGDGSLAMIAIRQNMPYVGLTFTEHHVSWLQLLLFILLHGSSLQLLFILLHPFNPVFSGYVTLRKNGN